MSDDDSSIGDDPAADFTAVLKRCGYNDATCQHWASQQFVEANDFAMLPASEVKTMLGNIAKSRNPEGVTYPYLAGLKVRGLRAYMDYRTARGQDYDVADYDGEIMSAYTQRVTDLEVARKQESDDRGEQPKPLSSFANFEAWLEAWEPWVGSYRSSTTGTPLSYVHREHTVVSAEQRASAAELDFDPDLEMTHEMGNSDFFAADNKRYWELLFPLIKDGPGWDFIKHLKTRRDGRQAIQILKDQCRGQAARQSMLNKAYSIIEKAKYHGRGRFTIDDYILKHQKAHTDLAFCKEPVSETKKVTDFLKGIRDPRLITVKTVIKADREKSENFQQCQLFVKTMVDGLGSLEAEEDGGDRRGRRQVSRAQRREQGGGRGGRGGRDRGAGNGDGNRGGKPRVRAGHYDKEEWLQLTEDEQAEVRKKRAAKKEARTVGSLARTDGGDVGDEEEADEVIPMAPPAKKQKTSDEAPKKQKTSDEAPTKSTEVPASTEVPKPNPLSQLAWGKPIDKAYWRPGKAAPKKPPSPERKPTAPSPAPDLNKPIARKASKPPVTMPPAKYVHKMNKQRVYRRTKVPPLAQFGRNAHKKDGE